MTEYLVRRIGQSLLVLFLVSLVTFGIIHAAPGGPVTIYIKPNQRPDQVAIQMRNMGLDKPLHQQYIKWLKDLARGNFGNTFKANRPIGPMIRPYLLNTMVLMGASWFLTLLLAIPWGIYNSTRQYGLSDNLSSVVGYAGFAMPAFWFGMILQVTLALKLKWLPLSDMYSMGHRGEFLNLLEHMVLPVTTLVIINLAGYLKYARSSMLEVLGQDYIRTARAKGVPERKVIFRHALRNALIPIITVLGMDLPILVSGATLTETVFNWPGMGRLFVEMANAREYTVLMAITIIITLFVVTGNLLADILYAAVDPRVRLTGKGASA